MILVILIDFRPLLALNDFIPKDVGCITSLAQTAGIIFEIQFRGKAGGTAAKRREIII